jgi:hypothetical protein
MDQWADRPPERVTITRVRARITDPARGATIPAGNTQPEVPSWNCLGYGNNAIEVSYIDVR